MSRAGRAVDHAQWVVGELFRGFVCTPTKEFEVDPHSWLFTVYPPMGDGQIFEMGQQDGMNVFARESNISWIGVAAASHGFSLPSTMIVSHHLQAVELLRGKRDEKAMTEAFVNARLLHCEPEFLRSDIRTSCNCIEIPHVKGETPT